MSSVNDGPCRNEEGEKRRKETGEGWYGMDVCGAEGGSGGRDVTIRKRRLGKKRRERERERDREIVHHPSSRIQTSTTQNEKK
jgi:hypothetical protein